MDPLEIQVDYILADFIKSMHMTKPRLRVGWNIQFPNFLNLDYCIVRAGIAHAVLEACDLWQQSLPQGASLLDVGCGSQPYRPWVQAVGLRYRGVDWPNSTHESTASDLIQWDLTKTPWPFLDQEFDALLCTEVLEHVPDPCAFLRECARISRTGALMMLTTPLVWPEHEVPYDYFRFTRFELRNLFELSGFSVEKVVPRGGWHAALGQIVGCWACHGVSKPWNYMARLIAWPIVASLASLDRCTTKYPDLLLTLGFSVFARRLQTCIVRLPRY
jgi:SAM-dependent methyltransferase